MKKFLKHFILIACLLPVGAIAGNEADADAQEDEVGTQITFQQENETSLDTIENKESNALKWSSLSMFVAAFAAPVFIMNCRSQPSALIYSGTSVFYIGSEMLNWKKYTSTSEKEMIIYSDVDQDKQKEAFEIAAEISRKSADAAKKKSKIAKMAFIGYSLASVTALVEFGMNKWGSYDDKCKKTDEADKTDKVDDTSKEINVGEDDEVGSIFYHFPIQKKYPRFIANAKSNTESYFLFNELVRMKNGESKSISLNDYDRYQTIFSYKDRVKNSWGETLAIIANIANEVKETIIPSAQAGFDKNKAEKIGLGSGLIGGIFFSKWAKNNDGVRKAIENMDGLKRAAIFGAHALLANTVSGKIKKAADILEDRASQYESLARQLNGPSVPIGQDQPIVQVIPQQDIPNPELVDNNNQSLPQSCFTGGTDELTPDEHCTCQQKQSCRVSEVPEVRFQGFPTPGFLTSSSNGLNEAATDLFAGNTKGALTKGGELIGNSNAISSYRANLEDGFNQDLKEQGKSTLDFAKLEKDQLNNIKSATANVLKGLGDSAKNQLLGLQGLNNGSNANGLNSVADAKRDSAILQPGSSRNLNYSKKATAKKNNKLSKLGFMFKGPTGDRAPASIVKHTQPTLEHLDIRTDEIDQRSGTSIFKLITNRYYKSAYPVFFEEVK